jgi:hypothetical protein
MKNLIAGVAASLLMWSTVPYAQNSPAATEATPAANATPPTDAGLGDLATMTFGCPKAALNAAAREAAKVRSQGTYQFSYFKILNDSHHASYEVQFTSNFNGEKPLRYCVAIYCQQGWDPRTTKTTVTLMGAAAQKTCHH